MRKRIWAVLLAVCLLMGLLPTTALAGGFGLTTYQELADALSGTGSNTIYLVPAADFGWPAEATLTIPANVGIQVESGNAWEIPNGITVNFAQNCYGIQCDELTINGTMNMAYSSQDSLFSRCDKVIIGPTGMFTCADDRPDYPTVYGAYIPAGSIWEVQEGGTLNCGVRLDGTLTGSGTVSGTVSAQGGFSSTATNATLSGDLTLTGGLIVGHEYLDSYADRLTVPAGSHITAKNRCWTSITNATLNLGGTLEFKRDSADSDYSNSVINAGGKIVMDGGKLIFNTPYELMQTVVEWEDGEEITYEKVRDNITEPLVDGTGVIRFNDKVSEAGQEYGRIMYCSADLVARTAQEVKAGTYDVAKAEALTWEPYYAIDLEHIDIERSWACEHTWNDGMVTTEPTCTEPGEITYTCTQCQTTRTEEVGATGHTEATDAAVAPTCTATGLTEGSHCSVCNAVLVAQETIPALGHAWSTTNCAEAATCTREGCGATRAAGEHVWGDWTVTKAATCTEDGSRTRTCTSCKVEASEAITKLGHSYSSVVTAPTCTEKGYTTHTCSRCGDSYVDTYENALGHDWGEGVFTTPPTLDADGVKTFTCQRCGETRTEAVPKLEKQNILLPGTSFEKTYGDADFYNTASNLTVGGGALTYASSDTAVARVDAQSGKVTIVGAGDAVITVTAAAVANRYAETSVPYTVTVARAPLTITAKDKAITYGEKAANSGYAVSGFVKDEDESVLSGEAVYNYTYKQYGNVGEYKISVSGLTAQNYAITFVDGNLTVGKATEYTITLSDLERLAGHVSGVTARIDPYDTTAVLSVEYRVDGQWTTDAPQTVGSYEVRAALTDSGNIVVPAPAAYTEGTLTVKPGVTVDTGKGPENNVDVAVEVSGGTAEITVTEENLDKIAANADGQVSIDLGSVSDVDTLVLPGTLVEELSKSDKAESLTVSTENASVTLSADVLDTVAKTVTGGEDTVSVRLESVTELNPAQQAALDAITTDYPVAVVNVSLVVTHPDGSTDTLHELGGNVTVTVPYEQLPGLLDGQYVVACYISDDGTVTYLFAQADETNRTITFTTNHFSNYAVFVSGKPTSAVTVDGGSGSGIYLAGNTVTIKADSKSGCNFAGWEVVSGGVTLADATVAETSFVMPAANVELRATYTKITSGGGGGVSTYTLTFDTNGGSKIDSVTKASGATIDLAGYIPTRAGYDFDGWYSDAKLTDKITTVKLTKNMTVYAKWAEKGGENPFTDVADDAYYADAVIWAVGKGITSGTTATTFSPNTPCTRAQAGTFLWRAAGSPEPAGMSSFADVPADSYYAKAVAWAVEQGITKGTSDTTFSPYATCTRAQIVTFLWRSQKSPASDGVNPFTDVAADAYYANAVLWAAENGIAGGTTANTFSPANDCTRAQIVTFLFRCLGVE